MNRSLLPILRGILAAVLVAGACTVSAAVPPLLDGLTQVQSRRVDALFLLPGADFRQFSKIMLDPAEVAFRRDWMRSVNRSRSGSSRIRDADAVRIADATRTGFGDIFETAFREAGYEIVTTPGADVLRISTAVNDLFINAPDQRSAGRSRVYTVEAGEATLVLVARDSLSGAILGTTVDRRQTRSWGGTLTWTNAVTNRSDFAALFRTWARIAVEGLAELKERSPVTEPIVN